MRLLVFPSLMFQLLCLKCFVSALLAVRPIGAASSSNEDPAVGLGAGLFTLRIATIALQLSSCHFCSC
jgi:hypothetical protein